MNNDYEYTVYENEKTTKKGRKCRVSIKLNRLGFGLLFIACAVFIVLDAIGISLGIINSIPVVTLIIGALFLAGTLSSFVKLKFGEGFFMLAFTFMIFEKYIARFFKLESENIINNWLVLLVALLLSIGVGLVLPKSSLIRISKKSSGKTSYTYKNENNLSGATIYIDCTSFKNETVTNNLGGCKVYFTNVDAYEGDGVLNLENNLGGMVIYVPMQWRINSNIDNSLGSVNIPKGGGDGKVLTVNGENNLGGISFKRV